MAGTLTTSSAERTIALCEKGIYEPCEGSEPLDLLARGMVESATGNLETAKDLLSEAYWNLEGTWRNRSAVQLAVAYWRGGEKSEASALLDTVPETFDAVLARALIVTDNAPQKALDLLASIEPCDVSRFMKGRLHNQRGLCLRKLGRFDDAVKEYTIALELFEGCPLRSVVENNLGGVLQDVGDRGNSQTKIDAALSELKGANLGKAYDQKSRALINDGDCLKAETYADCAIGLLEAAEHRAWLIEALITRAQILTAQQRFNAALDDLFRGSEITEYLGDEDLQFKVSKQIYDTSREASRFYHKRSVTLALRSSESLNSAARMLEVSRPALQEFMRTHGLTHNFKPRRSVITKL